MSSASLVAWLSRFRDVQFAPEAADRLTASVLRAVVGRRPDGSPEEIPSPLIPLLDTALLTNSPGEPRVGSQILAEVHSADRIDVVIAFIRRSGIAPLVDALRRHCEADRELRVLTTTYTNSTEGSALDLLQELGAEIRLSYDTTGTRLHAKSWLFHRESGFSTAYIVPYDPGVFAEQTTMIDKGGPFVLSPIELRPEPFQERLLEQIELSRQKGRHRNLLVSATGTGKTVMAAIDYARLRERLPRARLLFVAHRKEILDQSLRTFRQTGRGPTCGPTPASPCSRRDGTSARCAGPAGGCCTWTIRCASRRTASFSSGLRPRPL